MAVGEGGVTLTVRNTSSLVIRPPNPLPLKHGRICTEHNETINAGRHIIHVGEQYDSHLLVPVIPSK